MKTVFEQDKCLVRVPDEFAHIELDEDGEVEDRMLICGEERFFVPPGIAEDNPMHGVLEELPDSANVLIAALATGSEPPEFNIRDFVAASTIGHFLFPVRVKPFLEKQMKAVACLTREDNEEEAEEVGARNSRSTRSNKNMCEESEEEEEEEQEEEEEEEEGEEEEEEEEAEEEEEEADEEGSDSEYSAGSEQDEDSDFSEDEDDELKVQEVEEGQMVKVNGIDNFDALIKKRVVRCGVQNKDAWEKLVEYFINLFRENYEDYLKALWRHREGNGEGCGGARDPDCLYIDEKLREICKKHIKTKYFELASSRIKRKVHVAPEAQGLVGFKYIKFHAGITEDGDRLRSKGSIRPILWRVRYCDFLEAVRACIGKSQEWVESNLIFSFQESKRASHYVSAARMEVSERLFKAESGTIEPLASKKILSFEGQDLKDSNFFCSKISSLNGNFLTHHAFKLEQLVEHTGQFDVISSSSFGDYAFPSEGIRFNLTGGRAFECSHGFVFGEKKQLIEPVISHIHGVYFAYKQKFNMGQLVKDVSEKLGFPVSISIRNSNNSKHQFEELFYDTATSYSRRVRCVWKVQRIQETRSLKCETWEDVKRLASTCRSDTEAGRVPLPFTGPNGAQIKENLAYSFLRDKVLAKHKTYLTTHFEFVSIANLRRIVLLEAPPFNEGLVVSHSQEKKRVKVELNSYAEIENYLQDRKGKHKSEPKSFDVIRKFLEI